MASSTTTAFALPPGLHDVTIGTSLSRLLRQRKGAPAKRSNMPLRDFYSLRYNFKPSSVDTTKSGTLEVRKSQGDSASVTVEHPSTQVRVPLYSFLNLTNKPRSRERSMSSMVTRMQPRTMPVCSSLTNRPGDSLSKSLTLS
ncbi:uncharacterized protein BT62DRAFT_152216 [Guyanagaster necrorhizus]|uniref:Transcription elongation factor Eaf N-terminal domain-containing protein n=1 Tax=Guyanagaster necrorhizus TaxID=856835 RepID=A0A9P8AS69_9AGAR|nr:uncharacterized protein BT62DRAFT_152216 [Guyanagaster necrorhizus MCA 3950]KAG7446088.1 hypothetical protein BT62DRAFT_152216 [Guyanagaster necrorhizus MCA 3950]